MLKLWKNNNPDQPFEITEDEALALFDAAGASTIRLAGRDLARALRMFPVEHRLFKAIEIRSGGTLVLPKDGETDPSCTEEQWTRLVEAASARIKIVD